MNIQFSFNIYIFSNLIVQNNSIMDMDIDISRGRSTTSNNNSSRALLTYSNLSSIFYVERIEAQSNNLSWAKQVELNKMEEITLLYVAPKIWENKLANKATILNNTLNLQDESIANSNINTCIL